MPLFTHDISHSHVGRIRVDHASLDRFPNVPFLFTRRPNDLFPFSYILLLIAFMLERDVYIETLMSVRDKMNVEAYDKRNYWEIFL